MQDETKVILLVEDNPDDEALTLRAFAKNNISNSIVVVRDGAEALDWLFRRGQHANRGRLETRRHGRRLYVLAASVAELA